LEEGYLLPPPPNEPLPLPAKEPVFILGELKTLLPPED